MVMPGPVAHPLPVPDPVPVLKGRPMILAHGPAWSEWVHVLPWLGSGVLAMTIAIWPRRRR